MKRVLICASLAALWGTTAIAGDVALVLGNGAYRTLPGVAGGNDVTDARKDLARRGFEVFVAADAPTDEMTDTVSRFIGAIDDSTRSVVVVLSGQFAHANAGSWLLGTDAAPPLSLETAGAQGIPLSVPLSVLADYPGRALLVLGDGGGDGSAGRFLLHGAGDIAIPQGVTVMRGSPGDAAAYAVKVIGDQGQNHMKEARGRYRLTVSGYAPNDWNILALPRPSSNPEPVPQVDEEALWTAVRGQDTLAAYERYLQRFPDGTHAAEARAMIQEIQTEPFRAERLAEAALNLTRDARRDTQRDLSLLEYDPRGIDGVFGRGTRAAITRWQTDNRYPATGYLTVEQIRLLREQANRRAAELEEAARLEQAELERQDRLYWQETGARGLEDGFRSYLRRFPDGLFADVARDRLALIEESQRREAQARDRDAWDAAAAANTVQSYRAYLQAFPSGAFATEAQARIEAAELEDRNSAQIDAARRTEEALGLNAGARKLVEMRFEKLGLQPGDVDGAFDRATRRAIRRFQEARRIKVTGYLDEKTAVLLLTGSFLR